MEENEDEPDDVRKATPVEEEITRGAIDEHSGRPSQPIELARRRHHCNKDVRRKLKKSLKNEGECCRAKLAKAARAPKTAKVLVYEKECTLPKIKAIPRHCLSKEEWIDILATPSRKCPSPCLQREVTRKIRPVSTRMTELAQPPKNRLLNTLQDRAATLPTELVDNLIQTLEGEACLTPEQAERMFREKDIRARNKCRKRKDKLSCKGNKSNKHDEPGITLNASAFDKEAVNSQYLMAESFVKSILDWKCPIPREEFKDIAEVIMRRLGYVLEYNPVNGEDRKSQQMRFLADIVASWISGVLFDVAEAQKTELEEECARRRKEEEEESEEDSDDEWMKESDQDDDDDDDDDDDEGKDEKKKKRGSPPMKRKDDEGKKGRKDKKDDDDDDKKHGKSGTTDAEGKLEEDEANEPVEENTEEDDSKSGTDESKDKPEDETVDERLVREETGDEIKMGGDSEPDKEPGNEGRVISSDKEEAQKGKVDEKAPLDKPEKIIAEAEADNGLVEGEIQLGQQEDDKTLKISGEGKQEIVADSLRVEGKIVEATVVDISESLAESTKTEATPITIDEKIVSEKTPIKSAEKVAIAADSAGAEEKGVEATVVDIPESLAESKKTEATPISTDSAGAEEKIVEATVVDIPDSLPESKKTEATPISIDEKLVSEKSPVKSADKVATEAGKLDEDDEATIKRVETDKRAAGDRKDDKESPVEPTRTPEAAEIPERKQREIIPDDAEDVAKKIQEDKTVAGTLDDSAASILVEGIEKELKEDEEPTKLVKTLPSMKGKSETPKRKPSKIPSSIALVKNKKLRTDTPFLTFDKIFHTIYNAIEASSENPGIDAITNRIHRAVYEKCSSVVQQEKPGLLPELTKDVLDVLSGKIALWLRDVLTESQLSFMHKFPATVESVDVREWTKWIGYVSDTANTWSTWIQMTIRQAEDMRSDKVTRGDWLDWTKSVEKDALRWRRFYVQSLHQAHQNLTMIRDRRVVKTGARDPTDGDNEREMNIIDLEVDQ